MRDLVRRYHTMAVRGRWCTEITDNLHFVGVIGNTKQMRLHLIVPCVSTVDPRKAENIRKAELQGAEFDRYMTGAVYMLSSGGVNRMAPTTIGSDGTVKIRRKKVTERFPRVDVPIYVDLPMDLYYIESLTSKELESLVANSSTTRVALTNDLRLEQDGPTQLVQFEDLEPWRTMASSVVPFGFVAAHAGSYDAERHVYKVNELSQVYGQRSLCRAVLGTANATLSTRRGVSNQDCRACFEACSNIS